jgi:hypothetical protein
MYMYDIKLIAMESKEIQYDIVDNQNIYKHLKLTVRADERNKGVESCFKTALPSASDGMRHSDRDFVERNGQTMPETSSPRKRGWFRRRNKVNDELRCRTEYVDVCTKNTSQARVLAVTSVISLAI